MTSFLSDIQMKPDKIVSELKDDPRVDCLYVPSLH